jgi:hypothetical protein
MMTFIEHPTFTRQITELLTDDEYKDLQNSLAANPCQGAVIPGLGGLRKVRVALPGRGKRGGARIIYLVMLKVETLFMLYAYSKGDIADMTSDQKKQVRRIVEEIKAEYRP